MAPDGLRTGDTSERARAARAFAPRGHRTPLQVSPFVLMGTPHNIRTSPASRQERLARTTIDESTLCPGVCSSSTSDRAPIIGITHSGRRQAFENFDPPFAFARRGRTASCLSALGVDELARTDTVVAMLENNFRRAPGYWIQLTLAMGIATLGLVLGSTAVVIGAMLVSPLMGPILELGMGFAVGSAFLVLRASLRVALSVIVVVQRRRVAHARSCPSTK